MNAKLTLHVDFVKLNYIWSLSLNLISELLFRGKKAKIKKTIKKSVMIVPFYGEETAPSKW